MAPSIRAVSLALLALSVASCTASPWKTPALENIATRYPITVAPEMRTLRIPYGGPGAGMDANMSGQLRQFVSDYLDRGAGALSVSTPPGWEEVAREFAEEIALRGVPRSRILLGTDETAQRGAEVKIAFVDYVARTVPCGDWSVNVAETYNNALPPNFGCATQHNIAAMIADPRDLVAPRPMDPTDIQRALTVLERYRAGEPTPAERSDIQSGAVTAIGQN